MAGVSYAGGIQLVTAAIDKRVDAITPTIAWNSIISCLDKDGAPKGGWSTILVATAGGATRTRTSTRLPAALTTGYVRPTTSPGSPRAARARWSPDQDPHAAGGGDRRHPLHAARGDRQLRVLKANHVPLKMLWFCGGHGACTTAHDPAGLVESRVIAWLKRYLMATPP